MNTKDHISPLSDNLIVHDKRTSAGVICAATKPIYNILGRLMKLTVSHGIWRQWVSARNVDFRK